MTSLVKNDIRNVATQLSEVYEGSVEDYFYIKGFIHCLLRGKIPSEHKNPEKESHKTA